MLGAHPVQKCLRSSQVAMTSTCRSVSVFPLLIAYNVGCVRARFTPTTGTVRNKGITMLIRVDSCHGL